MSVLSKIVDIIEENKIQEVSKVERTELKKAIIDRIGCGLAARKLDIGSNIISFYDSISSKRSSTIWGTNIKTDIDKAALINGSISSHIEYDTHDSMISAAISLGELYKIDGNKLIKSLKVGYIAGTIIRKLLASVLEKRGVHWPSNLSALNASAACSVILNSNSREFRNALGIALSLSPVSPFEPFTKGASVKDFYGGWGEMLGLQSACLAKNGITAPITIFEGKRGLFTNWIGKISEPEPILKDIKYDEPIQFHFKPYPCCTAAHPTLTAIEKILERQPELKIEEISDIIVDTYKFGYDLSNESDSGTPIGAKINIPFLSAAFITNKELLPEHTEEPFLSDKNINNLAEKINIRTTTPKNPLQSRIRYANVLIKCNNGSDYNSTVKKPKWAEGTKFSDINKKFMKNTYGLFSQKKAELIISQVNEIESLKDINNLSNLLLVP